MAEEMTIAAEKNHRALGGWLLFCAFMVFAMMLIGAITRLTESGLSMVEWRPLIGFLPPLSHPEWERVFSLYQKTSQYQIANIGMSLEEFKDIFFWEYIHRLWGRLIGIAFVLPMFFFWLRGQVPVGYKKHLVILLLLGGLQAVIGWWMVTSGFVERTEVSQYRLAVHLGIAFFILGYLVWLFLGLVYPVEARRKKVGRGLRRAGVLTHAIIFCTVISGALVAGLGAGLAYNDWPFMHGRIFPEDYWDATPVWRSFFESLAAVQFNHRLFAYLTGLSVALLWIWSRRVALAPRARWSINGLTVVFLSQLTLGISTLMLAVPLELAVLHQGGAALTFCCALWVMFELRGFRDRG